MTALKDFVAVDFVSQRTVAGKLADRRYLRYLCGVAITITAFLALASSANAANPASHVTLHLLALPASFSMADTSNCEQAEAPNPCDGYQVTATDAGADAAEGPVTLSDTLPVGLKVYDVKFDWMENLLRGPAVGHPEPAEGETLFPEEHCSVQGRTVTCIFPPEVGTLEPDQRLRMYVGATVEEGALSGEADRASVSVPGEATVETAQADAVGSGPPTFGASGFLSDVTGADGLPDTQAGDRPYEITTRFDLATKMGLNAETTIGPVSVQEPRDAVIDLPVGLLGDAEATPKCTFAQLQEKPGSCPRDTMVGHLSTEPYGGETSVNNAIYNMVPEHGVAAEFGYRDSLYATHAIVASVVPTSVGYVLRATAREIPEVGVTSVVSVFYGDPAARQEEIAAREGVPISAITHVPMFTNSSDCAGGSHTSTLFLDSWANPGVFANNGTPAGEPEVNGPNWSRTESPAEESPPVTGCNALHFDAGFTFNPEPGHTGADEPAGYESTITVPQTETPGTLATPPLKTAIVTLPAGVSISPSAANGLGSCAATGTEGINLNTATAGSCPGDSKIGTVEVQTPLLEEPFTGSVYVAEPTCGNTGQPACTEEASEDGGLFAIYMEVSNENRGIHLKLKGKIEVGGEGHHNGLAPGQVRTSFIETPQFPFSTLKLNFDGGPRAPLANPQGCGTYTTDASLEPWSAPESGPDVVDQPAFAIGGCQNGFSPSFEADMQNPQAGAYAPFTLTFARHDGEQDLSGLTVNMPAGLLGKIAGIAQCGEAEANAGTCPAASRIGTATGAAGAGADPLYQSGPVYLTGPYNGGPFGLSVVVPANAGPYHLGNIVVRASIRINPVTAQVTVVSNPLPQSVDGVPLRLQTVNVTVGEAGNFTFNPTSCTPTSIGATISSTQGTAVPVSTRFQPVNCQALPFAPKFSASTQANGTTKGHGASLDVKIGYPTPFTSYANILKVDTSLPLALSSRLTTLQKACTETQFATDPANCPPAATVGTATAVSPALPEALHGPVYLVSHGGRAFPDLDVILQGDNVKIELTGNTDIKNGITYSKFETVPDAPVSSFELNLPEKENSILGAVKNLCAPTKTVTVKQKVTVKRHGKNVKVTKKLSKTEPESLIMPTTMTGQNGAVITQSTKISVTGCKASKPAKKAIKKKKKKGGKKK
jgi:hypothetical protein